MRLNRRFFKMPGFIPMVFLVWFFVSFPSALVAQEQGKIEVVIRNSAYEVRAGVIQPDVPATIVVRNLDKIEHGFTSPNLEDVDARVESRGTTTFGRGIRGVHIDPGAEVKIHFVPNHPGKFSFQCDLHPSMKGEILVFTVGAA